MLLPLRRLRRLTLPERAVHDQNAFGTLSEMPWVPHVHYWGHTCGERAHLSADSWRVHPWLHKLGRGAVANTAVIIDESGEEVRCDSHPKSESDAKQRVPHLHISVVLTCTLTAAAIQECMPESTLNLWFTWMLLAMQSACAWLQSHMCCRRAIGRVQNWL